MKSYFKKPIILLIFFFIHPLLQAQEKQDSISDPSGFFSLGSRNCISIFTTNGKSFVGTGAGGEFGIWIARDFNSHYFADWIASNIDNIAQRIDFHSGFSMMPQVFAPKAGTTGISAFPLVGICIDYTKFSITSGNNYLNGPKWLERYSFAVQAGAGATLPVSEKLDMTIDGHYMVHIGTDVEIERNGNDVLLVKKGGTNLEGHLLFAFSINYKLFRLWARKSS
jgi:hypothetical protein